MLPAEKETPAPERDSFISEVDFNTFDKLGFNDFGDSGMLIKEDVPP
jgi:hypothetical protein